jgi:hypothetical protein
MHGKVVGLVAAVGLLASVGIANAKGPVKLTDVNSTRSRRVLARLP